MKKKLISTFIFGVVASMLVACNNALPPAPSPTPDPDPEVVTTKYIVRNSRSDYSVVIPKNYKDKENVAAQALANYINLSTGAKLNIITDNEVTTGSHYISLGNTTVFNTNFAGVSMSELDDKISSYFISTKDDNIYIYSNPSERAEGTINGAYDLLHDLVGYEYYASDEIIYNRLNDINLREYNNFFVHPTFDGRSIGNFHLIYNQESCDNLRLLNQYRGTEWVSKIYGHGQVTKFVRPEDPFGTTGKTIHEAHPEWFSNKSASTASSVNNQLCWSAGEELEEYVANRFIRFFQEYPDATYFMFGQEDNSTYFCNCEKCQHAKETCAMNDAGLQIIFMNHVIERTEAWLQANQPGRQVRYVVFAYYATKRPPVVENGNSWVPFSQEVIPHDKLYFLYAPISCNFAFPLDNTYFNSDTFQDLKMWNTIANQHTMIYFYDVNFVYYFSNFYNFGSVKSMYQTCKDLGISYLYTQGSADSNTVCFTTMREYVESKLMWDISLDYDELVRDFMTHYFRDAYEEIYDYYQTLKDRLTKYHVENLNGGGIYTKILSEEIYPYAVSRYFINLFKRALTKIEHYRDTNLDLYNLLKARICGEYLSVIYITMKLSKTSISDDEKAELKEIFETYVGYYGLTREQENGPTIDVESIFG